MATYAGGSSVKRGYYIDRGAFEFATVEHDGDALPGGSERRWLYLPVIAVIAVAPALGSLFFLTLPFVGFGVVAYGLARKLIPAARAGARELGATFAPTWAPGEAHLTGEAPKKEVAPAAPAATSAPRADGLEQVAKEVEEARLREKK